MKVTKQTNRYCPCCKKHTKQKVSIAKTKPRPKNKKKALKKGVRQYANIIAGYGGSIRPVAHPSKTSKKVSLKYLCSECKKISIKQNPIKRTKKVEQA
jgi:large subunit ribosomal protein L44e